MNNFNKEYIQKKKFEVLQKRADYNDSMKTPIRILITDIVYAAKTNDKKLTIKDIQAEIIEAVGDIFTESQMRHNITALVEAGVLKLVPKGDKNYIYLTSEAKPSSVFLPAFQNVMYSTMVVVSVIFILFNYLVSPVPFLLTTALYALGFTFVMVSTQYLDFKLSLMGYRQIIIDFIINKFKIITQQPYILVYKERLQVLLLRFRKSEIPKQE
jgi:hypothetical protein